MGYIYKITNNINDKVYIGQTHYSLAARWRSHKYYAKNRVIFPLYHAMNKYGIENFKIEAIEECPDDKLNEREIYWIEQYGSYGKGGYNATLGGSGMHKYNSNEIKALWDEGYNIRKICRELHITPNTVKKILEDYPPFIKQRFERYLEATDKNRPRIRVKQFDLDGNYITTYKSINEAAKQTGADISVIVRVCKHRANYAGGYQWRYEDDDTPVGKIELPNYKVMQCDADGNKIAEFPSIAEASRRTGLNKCGINYAYKNNTSYKDYYWIPA